MKTFALTDVVAWPRRWVCVTCEAEIGLGKRTLPPLLLLAGDRRTHLLTNPNHELLCRSSRPE